MAITFAVMKHVLTVEYEGYFAIQWPAYTTFIGLQVSLQRHISHQTNDCLLRHEQIVKFWKFGGVSLYIFKPK